MNEPLLAVPHSAPQAAGTLVGYPSPARTLSITLSLRRQTASAEQTAQLTDLITLPPHLRHYPSHEELAAILGTTPDDLATVSAYFEPFGLQVAGSSLLTGSLTLSGPVTAFEQAFHTEVATSTRKAPSVPHGCPSNAGSTRTNASMGASAKCAVARVGASGG